MLPSSWYRVPFPKRRPVFALLVCFSAGWQCAHLIMNGIGLNAFNIKNSFTETFLLAN